MAKLYWRVKRNGKWNWLSADNCYEDDAYAICECTKCLEEEE